MTEQKPTESEAQLGANAWRTGHLLGSRYQLQEYVGGGSMGVIVRANDLHTGRAVAVKLMRAELRNQQDLQMRFIGEAMAMRRCESAHCVQLLDMGRCEELGSYIVMPYLQGDDFGNLLARGYRPDVATSVRYLLQVCQALQVAHAQGVVHCDIKPQNLFVTDLDENPSIQLLDFGIARCLKTAADSNSSRTPRDSVSNRVVSNRRVSGSRVSGSRVSGSSFSDSNLSNANDSGDFDSYLAPFLGAFEEGDVRGTPHYLAPEQLQGVADLNASTDIWSMGAVLFELITGREAFAGDDLTQILKRVLRAQCPDPRDDFPGPLRELHKVILRCLSRNPAHRYTSVQALADALEPFASSQVAGASVTPLPVAVRRLRHSTTERLSRAVIARSMATSERRSLHNSAVHNSAVHGSVPRQASSHQFALRKFVLGSSVARRMAVSWAGVSWNRAALGAGLLAAGLLGAFLGFHYLQWPSTGAAVSVAGSAAGPKRAAHSQLTVGSRPQTVRAARAQRWRAPRISRLPSGYRRNNSDGVPSTDKP